MTLKHRKDGDVEVYGDHEIQEYVDTTVPTFLKWVYVFLPIWGLLWCYFFWTGSTGYFDRGSWFELQKAAQTTNNPIIKSQKKA